MNELRIAIVGSRRRNLVTDYDIVKKLISDVMAEFPHKKIVVVSGACPQGADFFAAKTVKAWRDAHPYGGYRLELVEFPVQKWDGMSKWDFTQQAFGRNFQVADYAHVGYALVHSDRTGGTEDTVGHFHNLQKTCYLVSDWGRLYLDGERNPDKVGDTQA